MVFGVLRDFAACSARPVSAPPAGQHKKSTIPLFDLRPLTSDLFMKTLISTLLFLSVISAWARSYTNLAGQAIVGCPASIAEKTVTLTNGADQAIYRLAIFPEGEKRRLAADAGSTQFVPARIRLAIEGVNKALKRSQQRAEKGLCTKDEAEAFRVREAERMKAYLAHEVAEGRLLPSELKLYSADSE